MKQQDKYAGIWITADGYIRQELLPDGRYEEVRGKLKTTAGRYEISGYRISYRDGSGNTATGDFQGNDMLYQGGYTFYKEKKQQ